MAGFTTTKTMLSWCLLLCTISSLHPCKNGVQALSDNDSFFEDLVEDVVDWFEDLVAKAPKVVADCIINDIEQTIDTVTSFFVPECNLEAFEARIPDDFYYNHKVVGDHKSNDKDFEGSRLFVYDTRDPSELRTHMECADPNLEDIIVTADTLLTVKKGLRVSNVAAYLAVCFLQEIVEDTGCFDRESTKACLIHDKHNSHPIEAYRECFSNQHPQEEDEDRTNHTTNRKVATLVDMADLKAGDIVLSSTSGVGGSSTTNHHNLNLLFYDSVVVNMYRHSPDTVARRIRIQYDHSSGETDDSDPTKMTAATSTGTSSISVTPNHLVWADNEWKLAHQVQPGSVLWNGHLVKRVIREGTGSIINPVTFSGAILAFSSSSLQNSQAVLSSHEKNTTKMMEMEQDSIPMLSNTLGSNFHTLLSSWTAPSSFSSSSSSSSSISSEQQRQGAYPWWCMSLAFARAFPTSVQRYYETFDKVLEFVLDRVVSSYLLPEKLPTPCRSTPQNSHCSESERTDHRVSWMTTTKVFSHGITTTLFQRMVIVLLDWWLSFSFILFCVCSFISTPLLLLVGTTMAVFILRMVVAFRKELSTPRRYKIKLA